VEQGRWRSRRWGGSSGLAGDAEDWSRSTRPPRAHRGRGGGGARTVGQRGGSAGDAKDRSRGGADRGRGEEECTRTPEHTATKGAPGVRRQVMAKRMSENVFSDIL
jgi:hypothetical protein